MSGLLGRKRSCYANCPRHFLLVLVLLTTMGYVVRFSDSVLTVQLVDSQNGCHDNDNASCADLSRFQALMKNWPSSKPRAAVYLTLHGDNVGTEIVRTSLQKLNQHFISTFKYPVIIFLESGAEETAKQGLRKLLDTEVFFQEISYIGSVDQGETKLIEKRSDTCMSYTAENRNFQEFHSKLVYLQPILQENVDYVWRFDSEFHFKDAVPFDPFAHMKNNNLLYLWFGLSEGRDHCLKQLENNITSFMKADGVNRKQKWDLSGVYLNNMEVSNVHMWKTKRYQAFVDYLQKLAGIFDFKWADALIKTVTVNIFLKPEHVDHLSQFAALAQ